LLLLAINGIIVSLPAKRELVVDFQAAFLKAYSAFAASFIVDALVI